MAVEPTDAELLAVCQADLADCLAALYEADAALLAIMRETEDHRFGRQRYDITLDHLYETAEPAHATVRGVLAAPLTERAS